MKTVRIPEEVRARFWRRVKQSDGCWPWEGSRSAAGYGQIGFHGKTVYAHRLSFLLHVGSLVDGLTIDHLCRNRACVNPSHLEQVTRKENILRGEAPSAQQARRTTCKWGHPFSVDNTRITKQGRRVCKSCKRRWDHEHYLRRVALA